MTGETAATNGSAAADVVLVDVKDDVAVLTFNRPDRLNAWIPELQTRYFDLLDECVEREDVRAIVLTGAGRGFCAGADMQRLQGLSGGEGDGEIRRGCPGSSPGHLRAGDSQARDRSHQRRLRGHRPGPRRHV